MMVDQRVRRVNKPGRSDEVIHPENQLKVAHEVRAHFESITPKRSTKPNRSEPDPDDSLVHIQACSEPIPELNSLHQLKSQSQAIWSMEGGGGKQEEFVETEYYKQLEMIEKQHHTTGTGFIKIGIGNEEGLNIEGRRIRLSEDGGRCGYKPKSNPATNDWIPSSESDYQVHVSTKPSRSG